MLSRFSMQPESRCWRVAVHRASERVSVKGELSGDFPLVMSADVCSVHGALELLESWFNVDKQASFHVIITDDSSPPASLKTSHAQFVLHFVASTLEPLVRRRERNPAITSTHPIVRDREDDEDQQEPRERIVVPAG